MERALRPRAAPVTFLRASYSCGRMTRRPAAWRPRLYHSNDEDRPISVPVIDVATASLVPEGRVVDGAVPRGAEDHAGASSVRDADPGAGATRFADHRPSRLPLTWDSESQAGRQSPALLERRWS